MEFSTYIWLLMYQDPASMGSCACSGIFGRILVAIEVLTAVQGARDHSTSLSHLRVPVYPHRAESPDLSGALF